MTESPPDSETELTIATDSTPAALRRVVAALVAGHTVLLTVPNLALRVHDGVLHCAVRDPEPLAHRCEVEYEVLVENARRALEASVFAAHLPPLPRSWSVIDNHVDSNRRTLWTAP